MAEYHTEAVYLTHDELTFLRDMLSYDIAAIDCPDEKMSLDLFNKMEYHRRNPLWRNVDKDGDKIPNYPTPFKRM